MERRGILEFIGGVGCGTFVGYYVGAKELLGIQGPSTDSEQRSPDTGESAETSPENETAPSDTDETGSEGSDTISLYDDFEDGTLDDPEWRAVGGGPGGLAQENEIGIANDGHQSQYSLYLDQGGSISNFSAESSLDRTVSPSGMSFYIRPVSADQYTKNQLRLINGDTIGIRFVNHIQNDGLYFRFGDGNDEEDRARIRDGAISPDVERFVQVRIQGIDWTDGTIGEVYVDGERVATDAPFENDISGFDTVSFAAIGGGDTVFRVDDISWQ
ncbi:hypothetical protein [Halorubrum aethiopicum]|uniref:hypothetical protein n=1 Tax=Halorubrum aethiopicum TaxID=1758255 RepID=UPI00082A99C0|nr:hypothetical protein [Halorubrum aethiopicum]